MKNTLLVLATAAALSLSSLVSLAADTAVEGTVSGYTCVVLGKACPVDREDPVIAAEKVFVVVKSDGSYVFVPNVDRAILARHITEKVRVTGAADSKYNSVTASKLEVFKKDQWKLTWSLEMEEEARKMLSGQ